jgi:uncharacterized protein (TIGR02246 family)
MDIHMNRRKLVRAIVLAAVTLLATTRIAAAGIEDEVKAVFQKFIAAQNAHDLSAARELLQDSPQLLWIARGAPIRGRDSVLEGFQKNYEGTWVLEPEFDKTQITVLSSHVVQLFVPAMITIAPKGEVARARRFLLTQIYVSTPLGWKLATIVTIPAV